MSRAPLLAATPCPGRAVRAEQPTADLPSAHLARVTVQPMETHHNVDTHRMISPVAASRYARPSLRQHRTPPAPPGLSAASPGVLTAQPASTAPQGSPSLSNPITLDQKREGPRAVNLYVDTPQNVPTSGTTPLHQVITSQPSALSPANSNSSNLHNHEQITNKQPVGKTKKDPSLPVNAVQDSDFHTDSIICSKCGKCKCKACAQPRPCSSAVCNKKCECSALKCVNYCSCLFCIQCVFYHCFKDDEAEDDVCSADDPCACCERPHCCKRWTCMGLMSLCLPCLCLYWPLRGCLATCDFCVGRCSRKGCHCRRDKTQNITNRPLIPDSESSSA